MVGYLWKCPQSIPQVLMVFDAGWIPPGIVSTLPGLLQTLQGLSREASALQKYQKTEKNQKLLVLNPCTFMVCRQGQSEATRSVRGQGQWPLLGAPDSSGHFFSALLCPCFSTLDVQEEKLFYPCPESGEVNTPQWCALPAGKEKQFPFSTSQ